MISLEINNSIHKLPIVWLRENCRCSECFFQAGHQRLLDPADNSIATAEVRKFSAEDATLSIDWANGHRSEYPFEWIQHNGRFLNSTKPDDFDYRLPWLTQSLPSLPKIAYDKIIRNQTSDHLTAMAQRGVFLVTDAPNDDNAVVQFAEAISFSGVRSTNFGSMFNLKIHDHKNMKIAFTNKRIPLHNDLLIRRQPPTVTLLHCLQRSGLGGESLVADGLAIALFMRDNYPEQFSILTTVEVEVEDINKDWHYVSRRPVISVESGIIKSVHFNNWERSPSIRIDPKFYNNFRIAYKTFSELAHSDEFCHKIALQPGEIIVIDNARLLHGREAFSEEGGYSRHLQGCHIDVDDMISAYRKSIASEVSVI